MIKACYRRIVAFHKTMLTSMLLIVFLSSAASASVPTINAPSKKESVAVVSWLVAGPLPSPFLSSKSKSEALRLGYDKDYLHSLGGEGKIDITENVKIDLGNGVVGFTPHSWDGDYINLVEMLGNDPQICAYLYCEIVAKKKQTIWLHAGTNDAGKIWVGEKLVVENPFDGGAMRSQFIVKVELEKGKTPLLMKIDQAGGGWGAYVELYGEKAQEKFIADRKARDQAKDLDDPDCIATHIESKVICKQNDRYIGWPTITKLESGELLSVFSGDRDAHVCPWGKVQMIRSQDNGQSWSEVETINNFPLDDRDAGILETKSGTLLVSWFTSLAFDRPHFYQEYPEWIRHAEKLSPETREFWLGNWTRRSEDGGKTWEAPVKQNVSAPHGPIELADGRLLYVGTGSVDGEKVLGVEESRDDGRSWQFISTIDIPDDESIMDNHEPHVAELPDGKLVALVRVEPDDRSQCFLRQSESYDGGKTWTTTHVTPMWGYPPHLLVLENGWLLNVYGVRRRPYSERACISKDGGKSWDIENEIVLSRAMNGDLGYPASIQLDDGSILTIYYQIDQKGEKTSLHSTHWRLK
jgi:sialidase-1